MFSSAITKTHTLPKIYADSPPIYTNSTQTKATASYFAFHISLIIVKFLTALCLLALLTFSIAEFM